MRKLIAAGAMFAALGWSGRVAAHEGHVHKVFGTVAAVDASHVEVETKDGKKESYPLTPQTKYMKGKTSVALADVKVGTRVVLSIVEKDKEKTVAELLMPSGEKAEGAPEQKH